MKKLSIVHTLVGVSFLSLSLGLVGCKSDDPQTSQGQSSNAKAQDVAQSLPQPQKPIPAPNQGLTPEPTPPQKTLNDTKIKHDDETPVGEVAPPPITPAPIAPAPIAPAPVVPAPIAPAPVVPAPIAPAPVAPAPIQLRSLPPIAQSEPHLQPAPQPEQVIQIVELPRRMETLARAVTPTLAPAPVQDIEITLKPGTARPILGPRALRAAQTDPDHEDVDWVHRLLDQHGRSMAHTPNSLMDGRNFKIVKFPFSNTLIYKDDAGVLQFASFTNTEFKEFSDCQGKRIDERFRISDFTVSSDGRMVAFKHAKTGKVRFATINHRFSNLRKITAPIKVAAGKKTFGFIEREGVDFPYIETQSRWDVLVNRHVFNRDFAHIQAKWMFSKERSIWNPVRWAVLGWKTGRLLLGFDHVPVVTFVGANGADPDETGDEEVNLATKIENGGWLRAKAQTRGDNTGKTSAPAKGAGNTRGAAGAGARAQGGPHPSAPSLDDEHLGFSDIPAYESGYKPRNTQGAGAQKKTTFEKASADRNKARETTKDMNWFYNQPYLPLKYKDQAKDLNVINSRVTEERGTKELNIIVTIKAQELPPIALMDPEEKKEKAPLAPLDFAYADDMLLYKKRPNEVILAKYHQKKQKLVIFAKIVEEADANGDAPDLEIGFDQLGLADQIARPEKEWRTAFPFYKVGGNKVMIDRDRIESQEKEYRDLTAYPISRMRPEALDDGVLVYGMDRYHWNSDLPVVQAPLEWRSTALAKRIFSKVHLRVATFDQKKNVLLFTLPGWRPRVTLYMAKINMTDSNPDRWTVEVFKEVGALGGATQPSEQSEYYGFEKVSDLEGQEFIFVKQWDGTRHYYSMTDGKKFVIHKKEWYQWRPW